MASELDVSNQQELRSGGGMYAPTSFFGGNQEVYSSLDSIEFQGSLGDSSMRGNTAYITLWTRNGAALQSSQDTSGTNPEPPASDQQTEILSGFGFRFLDPTANLATLYNYNPRNLITTTDGLFNSDTLNYLDAIIPPQQFGQTTLDFVTTSDLAQRRKDVSAITPETSEAGQINRQVINPPKPKPFLTQVFDGLFNGIFKSANPNRGLYYRNAIVKPYSTAPSQITYSGSAAQQAKGNPYVGKLPGRTASTAQGPMMWQFLFNPSELELDMGPEFKNAETWGVSDKANSGQPLHWSNNKNVELKFNSILLNGFVFGKKVEALEQGLIELFMARDGQGQHGPHVLKFVWGKREFGPCVIKNINIKEKMWDEGLVVNAELSFTLEQVPEWTINDGFVDVARPGKIGVEGNPAQTSRTPQTPPAPSTPPTPPAGPSNPTNQPSPDQKPKNTPQTRNTNIARNKCAELRKVLSELNRDEIKSSPSFLGLISQETPRQAKDRFDAYKRLYARAVKNQITRINVGRYTPSWIEGEINKEWDRRATGLAFKRELVTYPFKKANELVSTGVGFLRGSVDTQLAQNVCVKSQR